MSDARQSDSSELSPTDRNSSHSSLSSSKTPHTPTEARTELGKIRHDMETITKEFADGKLSQEQFDALYAHYSEKRTIIEKLLERDPNTTAWKAAAAKGRTGPLRVRLEARPLYFLVFAHGGRKPLIMGGKQPQNTAQQIYSMLKTLWMMKTHRTGLARKAMGSGLWLILAMGDISFTMVIFSLQPSEVQINRVRDLHNDFERANHITLQRSLPPERMVFPQRSLLEERT